MGESSYGWLDVRRIAEELADRHADIDPLTVSFPRLREMAAGLPGFVADPRHNVNERILEEIQRLWIEERE